MRRRSDSGRDMMMIAALDATTRTELNDTVEVNDDVLLLYSSSNVEGCYYSLLTCTTTDHDAMITMLCHHESYLTGHFLRRHPWDE